MPSLVFWLKRGVGVKLGQSESLRSPLNRYLEGESFLTALSVRRLVDPDDSPRNWG
jgi:hypothetical protein